MSLKSFHIVFITLAILLAVGCAVGAFSAYRDSGAAAALFGGIASSVVGVALVVYGIWFLRKSRKLII